MTPLRQKGDTGEEAAVCLLEQKGWKITARNWRCKYGELDIVAWDTDGVLVFVEVKTRSSEHFGGPEAALNFRKRTRIIRSAVTYMESTGYEWKIRFDVMAVIHKDGEIKQVRHLEDAFFY